MVRFTLKRSLREESCCRVEVMKGATGLRRFSLGADGLDDVLGAFEVGTRMRVGRLRWLARNRPAVLVAFDLSSARRKTGGFFGVQIGVEGPVFLL